MGSWVRLRVFDMWMVRQLRKWVKSDTSTWEWWNRSKREGCEWYCYQAFEVEILNQINQKTLVKPCLPCFWGGKFQPGLPGKPGNTRLTKHFWLGFLSRDLSYQTFMVNYNQTYLESLVKPGSTRLSILVDNCQKPGKSGSTGVYQAHPAFNQTFGARECENWSW